MSLSSVNRITAQKKYWPVLGLVLLTLTALFVPTVQAATITVNTTADENNNDGDCSLREAIIAANTDTAVDACPAGSGTDTISLPAGDYVLSIAGKNENAAQTGDLDLTTNLSISGAGRADTTIDADKLDRVLEISAGNMVQISGVTITGGRLTSDIGGGILVENGSTLILSNSRMSNNTAANGGGIYVNDSILTLIDSRVSGNNATGDGGGFYVSTSTLTLSNSRVDVNKATSGGGIFDSSSTLILTDSRINGNIANYSGGGIYDSASTLTLTNSRIDGNDAGYSGGGINAGSGNLTLTNSRVDGNTVDGIGGGIYLSLGTLTITNSQVSSNTSAFAGGGISSGGTLTLVNSTISGNNAVSNGGGLDVRIGTSSLYNVTISNNSADSDADNDGDGGGVYITNFDGTLIATHSIIGGNSDNSSTGNQHPDCSGTLIGAGHNLIENTTGCTLTGSATGNINGVSPNLGPLQDNGGSTLTHALLDGSQAINAGSPSGCFDQNNVLLSTDQRGNARVGLCDIGAFESASAGIPTPTPTPTATPVAAPTTTPTPNVIYLPIIHK